MDATRFRGLADALARGPALRLAVLFGSAASGRLRADSDVDVAILPRDPDLPLRTELELQTALTRACGREVDLVRLDHATTLLLWEVARTGRPLLEVEPKEFARFRARAAAEWADFAPAYARAGEVFRQRLASGPAGDKR